MKRYRIYVLVDPRNGEPFYVGATTVSLKKRVQRHIEASRRSVNNKQLRERILAILRDGCFLKVWLLERTWAPDREGQWINHMIQSGYVLLNSYRQERSIGATSATCDIAEFRARYRV
jgi:hypothetical protein